jgi:hypothetical protein
MKEPTHFAKISLRERAVQINIRLKKLREGIKFLICIREVTGSNLCRNIEHPEIFHAFPQSHQDSGRVPQVTSRPLPFKSSSVQYSLIPTFDTTLAKLLIA